MKSQPVVISRNSIPVITEVNIDGELHFLGEHRDFGNNEFLKNFFNEENGISFSWTRLKNNEQLDAHTHPVKSVIIICSGNGLLLGDLARDLSAGDIVIIPPHCSHGFRGVDDDGFHALSIQFQAKSLYAKGQNPLVKFQADINLLENKFLQHNAERIKQHLELRIFTAIKNGTMKNERYLNRMLSFLRTWSTYFQKLVMLRYVTCSSDRFGEIAQQHLVEEFGHDSLLKNQTINDPIIKSISTWFVHQMVSRNDLEKHIIVHCVLENGAHLFHDLCAKHLSGTADSYFSVHVEHDENHSEMGLDLIIDNFSSNELSVLNTLDEAWDMLDLLFERAFDIIIKE